MKTEDVLSIIDEFDPATLSACCNCLAKIPCFANMSGEGDLKPLLERFFKTNETAREAKNGFEEAFLEIASDLVDIHIEAQEDSRESKYIDLMKKASEPECIPDNAVLVVLSLFRSLIPLHSNVPQTVEHTDFCLNKEDVDTLFGIYETIGLRKILYKKQRKGVKVGIQEAKIPTLPVTNKVYKRTPPGAFLAVKAAGKIVVHAGAVVGEALKVETVEERVYFSEDDKQFFFVLGTIVFYRLLQYGEENE